MEITSMKNTKFAEVRYIYRDVRPIYWIWRCYPKGYSGGGDATDDPHFLIEARSVHSFGSDMPVILEGIEGEQFNDR